jgi:hypothetical protein
MMIEWISVLGSSWITAEAYSAEEEAIYVRFADGGGWRYTACPPNVWAEFTAEGQSRGQYINRVLRHKPGGKFVE